MDNYIKNVDKILDFWITLENVQQEEFPAETKLYNIPNQKPSRGSLKYLLKRNIEWDKVLYLFFEEFSRQFPFAVHGTPTFFIGKLDLEPCLYELAYCLNQDYQPIEKNKGKIAVFAISLSSDFQNVEAFSFSPILREICNKKGIDIKNENDIKSELQECLDAHLEQLCLKKTKNNDAGTEDKPYPISLSVFKEYLTNIIKNSLGSWYEDRNGTPQAQNPVVLMNCMLYDTQFTMDNSEEPPLSGLSNNFFSEDLELVRSCFLHDKNFLKNPMGESILKYILSVSGKMNFEDQRTNLVPKAGDDITPDGLLRIEFDNVLSPSMAPLGKWPGRYMPVLMQEVAINAYTKRFHGDNGRIFSVNGPPGTGKTTLLKEIVAEHIVERANILSTIKNPDSAFQVVPFQEPEDCVHSTNYAKFKPEYNNLHNYSILITSSNNKAVENISKELPQTKSVLESFDGVEDDDKLHSDIIQGMIEIRSLFTKNPKEDTIPCFAFPEKETQEKPKKKIVQDIPDIYFSKYADQLLNENENAAWGLISCALGKKENINNFSKVLKNLIYETFSSEHHFYERHVTRYKETCKLFREQYVKMKQLQKDLSEIWLQNKNKFGELDSLAQKLESIQSSILSLQNEIRDLEEKHTETKVSLQNLETELRVVQKSKNELAPFAKETIDRLFSERKLAAETFKKEITAKKTELTNVKFSLEQQELSIKSIQCDIDNSVLMRKTLSETMPNAVVSFLFSSKKEQKEKNQAKILELEKEEILLTKRIAEKEQDCLHIRRQIQMLSESLIRKEEQLRQKQSAIQAFKNALTTDNPWSLIDAPPNEKTLTQMTEIEAQENRIRSSICEIQTESRLLEEKIACKKQTVLDLELSLDDISQKKADLQSVLDCDSPIRNENQANQYTAMTLPFFHWMSSEDIDDSTKAQVQNPWFTEEFNREREKLFRLALRVHREFILASKSCRSNLLLLTKVWAKPFMNDIDRKAAIPELLRTLWLLVPVISTTFASVGRFFQYAKMPGLFGTLVVDEAGQASPQMAIGALYRARRAIIVGDPKQVEPVVTDALKIIRNSYKDQKILLPYLKKSLSVQQFADCQNPLGTYLNNSNGEPEWVGCPLLVHRRCIDPMYSISNNLSYSGIMKLKTLPPKEKHLKTFIHSESTWFDIKGKEVGAKNHFVKKQGDFVLKLLNVAFQRSEFPSLYIISPFKSVADGIRDYLKENASEELRAKPNFLKWVDGDSSGDQIGTVHTFQGKEANEVIFLLGCDKDASGAIQFVNENIVNVAATRAKYRLYVVGDKDVWMTSSCVSFMLDYLKVTLINDEDSSSDSNAVNDGSEPIRYILSNNQIKSFFRRALGLINGKPSAEEELDIISPWISSSVIDDTDPEHGYNFKESFQTLLNKNVIIKILYGISYGNKEQQKRDEITKACVNKLKTWFGEYPNFKLRETNTHRKLFICDRSYYVISSMNILSNKGNFESASAWSEGGEASRDQDLIDTYRNRDFQF